MKSLAFVFTLAASLSVLACDHSILFADAPQRVNNFIKESYPNVRTFRTAWISAGNMQFSFVTDEGQLALGKISYKNPDCKRVDISVALRSEEQTVQ